MANRRHSVATTFTSILSLGALAVAVIVIAVSVNASAGDRIAAAERDHAAVDLLEQRQQVSALYAAEAAATVMDALGGADSMEAAPVTAQRLTTVEAAADAIYALADRTDSVGGEAQRWLTAMGDTNEPTAADEPFSRLVRYDTALEVACCAGLVPSDAHHTDALRGLESLASVPHSPWDHFYLAIASPGSQSAAAVDKFLGHLGVVPRIPPDTQLPSEQLSEALSVLPELGVSRETISTLLSGDSIATLDAVVANASGRSRGPVAFDEAYAAADAVYRSVDELFAQGLELTRTQLASDIETADQTRLLALVLSPIALVVLAGVGLVVYRFARNRERALQREQDLVDARNRFMRMVSHELRTPATAISGFAEMLGTDWTSLTEPEIAEFLAIINRQATHLSLIVDDLLTLSHLETGRLRLHLSISNLHQAVEEAISMVDARYGIEVTTAIDPSVTVVADPDRLVQILRNLVENAAKYGKVGVEVTAAVVGSGCEIVVSDDGPGIPPEMAARIFRFWDRGAKDGSRVRGYGMGLAIARHLARAMVGDLSYRPHEPIGSEFVLSLPLGPTDQHHDADRHEEEAAAGL